MQGFSFSFNRLQQSILVLFLFFLSVFRVASGAPADWKEKTIKENLELVAAWQIAHPVKRSHLHWTYGAFYSGLMQYALANPQSMKLQTVRTVGEGSQWGILKRPYHADDHAIGHAWMEMAIEDENPAAAEKIRAVLDKVMARPSSASLEFQTPGCQDRWCWSDALFMAPPVFAKLAAYTGDRRYLEFMDR
ncbi:MAG: hypothetical protein EGQ81_01750, partial [Akkermansia sp.]|nr:hypothetical protein [Akkermansia sp.]